MFADELRRAIEDASRVRLDQVARLMWSACAAGKITEAEAVELSTLIEFRRTVPKATRKKRGSRPRTPESTARRRRLAASGRLPPALASHFSLGEMAVMAVLAMEVMRWGQCTLCIETIASYAGVCRTTVKNALRHAEDLKLVTIEERRQTFWRNLTNVVRIVSPEWEAWNRLAPRAYHLRGGGKFATGTSNLNKEDPKNRPNTPPRDRWGKGRGPGTGTDPGASPPESATGGR